MRTMPNPGEKIGRLTVAILLVTICCKSTASDMEDFDLEGHIIKSSNVEKDESSGITEEPDPDPGDNITDDKTMIHQDERCRCTCPDMLLPNSTKVLSKIYIGSVTNTKDCSCPNIVLPKLLGGDDNVAQAGDQDLDKHVCPLCKCVYQRRNLMVMYVVVSMVIIIISMFVAYVVIVEVILPKINRMPTYKQQTNDEVGLTH